MQSIRAYFNIETLLPVFKYVIFQKKIIQTYQYVNDFVVRFGCIINCKLAELFLL